MTRTALITGAARRLGGAIAERLHAAGYNLVLHFRHSAADAKTLEQRLNRSRADSCRTIQADLRETDAIPSLVERAAGFWGELHALVNNASGFYATPFGDVSAAQWDDLLASNLKAPFFLAQAAFPLLAARGGSIVNIGDIHGEHGLAGYPVYSIAKSGIAAMTRILAREMAPSVRINCVAPGAILWPESATQAQPQAEILARIPLGRRGQPEDIAKAVLYLLDDAPYVTGQILTVDGGRTLST